MKKDPERIEAKRAEIVAAALELFFAKGYEGTSIRMIQDKIGRQVGGFYYHFESKDAVFDAAIELFFEAYEKKMDKIIEKGKKNPSNLLMEYFDYIYEAVKDFRSKYLNIIHLNILGAIREHTMEVMHEYVTKILVVYRDTGIFARDSVSLEVAANILTYGVGGSILYQSNEQYKKQIDEIKCIFPILLGCDERV